GAEVVHDRWVSLHILPHGTIRIADEHVRPKGAGVMSADRCIQGGHSNRLARDSWRLPAERGWQPAPAVALPGALKPRTHAPVSVQGHLARSAGQRAHRGAIGSAAQAEFSRFADDLRWIVIDATHALVLL